MSRVLFWALLALPGLLDAQPMAERVRVNKSDSRLYLYAQGQVYASFPVVFGLNPVGHKQQEGDRRTPEGRYVLDYKKADSAFHRAIHISYPNEADRARAAQLGVDPGGAIMIHGQKNGRSEWLAGIFQRLNWTDGCIALSNADMDQLWALVEPGTPIEIEP